MIRPLIAMWLCWISLGSVFVLISAPPAKDQATKESPETTATTPPKLAESKRIDIELNGHTFSLPEGFSIELVAGPPLVDRPITASFDEDGRLYVSDSSGTNDPSAKQLIDKPHRVVRLEDTDGDGQFDKSLVFADKLMFPEGTLWHDGSLYVAAPPSIWKLTDTDNDGVADQREEWFKGNTLTGCANDLHGPYLGPDGFLYWCKGAFAEQTYERPIHQVTRSVSEGERSTPPANANENKTADGGHPTEKTKPWTTKASHIFRARPDAPRDPATGSIKTSAIECVMTGGMDNPVDVVFTPTGERIFTTTFLVHPGGGNRDGLLHAVYGGVYGKDWNVIDSPSHPRTGDVMPVLCHLGAAAPCGLERLQSSAWGREYQDNLFACCFNMRKVTRHVLQPHGATFKTEAEDFVVSNNLDFHPTDVLEDADGSLLIVDTGGWYKLCCPTSQLAKPDVLGAIYRVRKQSERKVVDYSKRASLRSRKLIVRKIKSAEFLVSVVADRNTDRVIRAAAVAELTRRKDGLSAILEYRRNENARFGGQAGPDDTFPRLDNDAMADQGRRDCHLLWALTQFDDPQVTEAISQSLSLISFGVQHVATQAISLRRAATSDDRQRLILKLNTRRPSAFKTIESIMLLKRLAAEALGRLGEKSAVKPLLEAATLATNDRFLEHSIIYALIEIAQPEATRAGLSATNPATIKAALIALDQMPNGGLKPEEVAKHLTSPEPLLRETAAWIISRHADWGEALAGYLRERLAAGELTDAEQKTLGQQLAQFAKAASVQELLAATVRDTKLPTSARLTALGAMRDSKLKELPRSWSAALLNVLSEAASRSHAPRGNASTDAPRPVQNAASKPDAERQNSRSHAERGNEEGGDDLSLISLAVNTARVTVPAKDDAAAWRKPLLTIANQSHQSRSHALRGNASSDAPRPAKNAASKPDAERQESRSHAERGNEENEESRWTITRLGALAALPGGLAANEADDKLFDFLLSQLASELSVVQRGTAAEVLSKAKLSKAQLTKLTEQFATTGPLEVDRLLGAFEQSTDEQVGQQLIAQLKTAPALTALRPDAIKTRLAKYSPSVQEAAQPLYAALNVDLGKQRQQLEEMLASLPPGDIVRGQKVFHNEKAACKACHALGYLGGKTGPDLTRIGGIRNERDLLESILFPSASFVRSFEPVLIVTTSGKTVNGLIRSETPDEFVIATGPNKEERVARTDIEEMKPSSISIMPAGLEKQITKEQLADLIAFLKNCK